MAYRRKQGSITRASTFKQETHHSSHTRSKSFAGENVTFKDDSNKSGFWGVLARKAKSILEEDDIAIVDETSRFHPVNPSTLGQEGGSMKETKTTEIVKETRELQISKKGNNLEGLYPAVNNPWKQSSLEQQMKAHYETQLKATRDGTMAEAAKAKLLLRELKTVKADLAFAKERCTQLEEENKVLRENRDKRDNRADDDLIRLQLETLLAEKARLAHENSIYARENRFLREIVEYHQLTMEDVVSLEEGMDPISPKITKRLSNTISPTPPPAAAAAIEEDLSKHNLEQPTVTEEEKGTK